MFAIGALSRASGVKIETIRWYERIGLIPTPSRSAAGRRLYQRADARRLIFIKNARGLGFGLTHVRALLNVEGRSPARCREARELGTHHLAEVRAKIRSLRAIERALTNTLHGCHGGEQRDCPLIHSLSIGDRVAP
ncbi:MAG: MerR family DNA-binding protein [Pseudomonadota bacterium]